ncbi:MAG: hypothetical protein H7A47_03335 [Verrucomicrobiales bacterium]|nr:hypothetical protein [Verrucomicrobiales bacterium]
MKTCFGHCFRRWVVCCAVTLLPIGAHAQVNWFFADKNALWRQTSANPAFVHSDSVEWVVGAGVGIAWDYVDDVTVEGPVVSIPMNGYYYWHEWSEWVEDEWGGYEEPYFEERHDWWGRLNYPSRADLLADWPPDGVFDFTVLGGWLDGEQGTITFTAPEPGQIPVFTNFEAIQSIDPATDFTFEWAAWQNPTGYIPFDVSGPSGWVAGGALAGTDTSFTVPAGTFIDGETYRATVNFSSGYFGTDTEWEGAAFGHQYWNYRTEVEFTIGATPPPPDGPIVIDEDTVISGDDPAFAGVELIIDGAEVTGSGCLNFASLELRNGAMLTHAAGDTAGLCVNVLGDAVVEAGSRIDVSGRGYAAGTGPGTPGAAVRFNSGGSYGGVGGVGRETSVLAPINGSITEPTDLGSGGGQQVIGADVRLGGPGGGAVRLTVGGVLLVEGVLAADGQSPGFGGGGSGESLDCV